MVPSAVNRIIIATRARRASALYAKRIFRNVAFTQLRHMRASIRGDNRLKGDRRNRCRIRDAGSDFRIWRIRNVEPSAQFSDGDASDRLFRGGPGAGAGDKSRGRQEPFPDFRRHLHCLPQEPARPAEDRAAGIAAGLPAPALHHQQRHGRVLASYLVSNGATDTRVRRRPAQAGQGRPKPEASRSPAGRRAARPARPQAAARARRRRPPSRTPTAHAAGEPARPQPQAAGAAGRGAGRASRRPRRQAAGERGPTAARWRPSRG